jgi:cellulose synthase/poly-beta-1,6-N-acetylglucosamine synthase-like glycosyltransferase
MSGEIVNLTSHILLFATLYFEVFLLITFFERYSRIASVSPSLKRLPSVSVIVPCYNEERTVTRTLQSLLKLRYPKHKLNIIVVDDGSTDNTWRVLQRFQKRSQITLLQKENGGKHTALNLALEHVTTELVGCLDADSFVDPQALKEIVLRFADPTVMAVTPAIKVNQPKTLIQHIQNAEYNLSIFIRHTFAALNSIFITPGPFSIFRTHTFHEIGMYKHAHNTEDLEMALRMQQHHFRIENAHRALVYTNAPHTLRKLIKQRVRWTYGFLKNILDYRPLFFSAHHGNLGLLVLPTTIIAIFAALYFTILTLWLLGGRIAAKALEVEAIGLSSFAPQFGFDWFFINTDSLLFLIYTIGLLTIALIMLGKKLAHEQRMWTMDIVYYMVFYGFLAPIWLAKALVDAVRSKPADWTAERHFSRK